MSEYDVRGTADQPDVSERSFGELVGNLSSDLSRLVSKEIALAKAETKDELSKVGQAAGMGAGAAVAALLALTFLSQSIVHGLDNWMGTGWAALIVGVLWVIAAAVLASIARSKLKQAAPPLEQTKETLKEDAQWAKTLNS